MNRNGFLIYSDDQEWNGDQSKMIRNGGGYLMRRVLRMLLWQQGRGFYGNREEVAIEIGDGCYRDRRWLLWRWEMVAMVTW